MTAQATLGLILGDAEYRDAVHIALAPVVAAQVLSPGEHIGLTDDGKAARVEKCIGIVDPFLKKEVRAGERCWLFLYPNSIVALRHEWTHPSFPAEEGTKAASQKWLDNYAKEIGITAYELKSGAQDFLESGEYICEGGRWEGFRLHEDFWKHYQNATGTVVPESKQWSFFTCSC